jgi:hypothetical protein
MKNKSYARQESRQTDRTPKPRASAGPKGISIAPPTTYGIDVVPQPISKTKIGQPTRPKTESKSLKESVQMKAQGKTLPTNDTGLPDTLKAGVENLSGMLMDDVKVHYNSDKPSQLQALAYTQGTDIYVSPGQEKHLPHEAWHVVQQKQGRVKPTIKMKGAAINVDSVLEWEADEMGRRAAHVQYRPEVGSITDEYERQTKAAADAVRQEYLAQTLLNTQRKQSISRFSITSNQFPIQRRIYTLGRYDDEPNIRSVEELKKIIPELKNKEYLLSQLNILSESSKEYILSEDDEDGKISLSEVEDTVKNADILSALWEKNDRIPELPPEKSKDRSIGEVGQNVAIIMNLNQDAILGTFGAKPCVIVATQGTKKVVMAHLDTTVTTESIQKVLTHADKDSMVHLSGGLKDEGKGRESEASQKLLSRIVSVIQSMHLKFGMVNLGQGGDKGSSLYVDLKDGQLYSTVESDHRHLILNEEILESKVKIIS